MESQSKTTGRMFEARKEAVFGNHKYLHRGLGQQQDFKRRMDAQDTEGGWTVAPGLDDVSLVQ